MKLEIGSGEHPAQHFDIHTDIIPLSGISLVCSMENLPFKDLTFDELRANDVLEHQSWELIRPTLMEWARVLKPAAGAYIQVPNARLLATQWVKGELSTQQANYWILGGHSERLSHRGKDGRNIPRWLWNAHHCLFDEDWLRDNLEQAGFTDISIESDGGSNLMCWSRKNEGFR